MNVADEWRQPLRRFVTAAVRVRMIGAQLVQMISASRKMIRTGNHAGAQARSTVFAVDEVSSVEN
jgi:hypothetical protein